MTENSNQKRNVTTDSAARVGTDNYDAHITPAETAAREQREGEQFKTTPTEEREASAQTDDQTDAESIDTTGGYTVDREGLLNNYAIEPEMYYEVPGDAREATEADVDRRAEEYQSINQDEEGKLTMEGDKRGKGSGIV